MSFLEDGSVMAANGENIEYWEYEEVGAGRIRLNGQLLGYAITLDTLTLVSNAGQDTLRAVRFPDQEQPPDQ